MRSLGLLVILGILAVSTPPLMAQSTGQLQIGARVRLVSLDGRRRTGTLSGFTTDSIFLAGSAQPAALARLSTVQVSQGKHRLPGALIGGTLGLVVGAVGGGLTGAAIYRRERDDCENVVCAIVTDPHIGAAAGVYAGGALGLVSGAIIGSLVKNERWHDVSYKDP